METIKTRTIKELLQLMLDNQDFFTNGLCEWRRSLWLSGMMTYLEKDTLFDYFSKHLKARDYKYGYYYFPKGELQPRIDWINKHIKLQP